MNAAFIGGMVALLLASGVQAANVRELVLNRGENVVTTGVLDVSNGYAMLAVSPDAFKYSLKGASGTLVRVRLSDLTRAGTLVLSAGEQPLNAAVLDRVHGRAYFGTYGDPNRGLGASVVQVRLNPLARLKALTLTNEEAGIQSAVVTPTGDLALFGTLYGTVVGIDTARFQPAGSLGLQRENNTFRVALVEPRGEFGYFAVTSGNILKIQIRDFSPVASMRALAGEKGFTCGFIDAQGAYLYLATGGSPAKVIRLALPALKPAGDITFESGENAAMAIGPAKSPDRALVITGQSPARAVLLDLASFKRIGAQALPTGKGDLTLALLDSQHSVVYLAISGQPARILKVPLNIIPEKPSEN